MILNHSFQGLQILTGLIRPKERKTQHLVPGDVKFLALRGFKGHYVPTQYFIAICLVLSSLKHFLSTLSAAERVFNHSFNVAFYFMEY